MDRFHTKVCNTLFEHLKGGLNPPILTKKETKELKQNIENLVLISNLHIFDDGDTIWKKLSLNKHKISYFDKIDFLLDENSCKCKPCNFDVEIPDFCDRYNILNCVNFLTFAEKFPLIQNIFERQNINYSYEPKLEVDREICYNCIQTFLTLAKMMVGIRNRTIVVLAFISYNVDIYLFVKKYKNYNIEVLSKLQELINNPIYFNIVNEFNIDYDCWIKLFTI